jgi:hypothetical protein
MDDQRRAPKSLIVLFGRKTVKLLSGRDLFRNVTELMTSQLLKRSNEVGLVSAVVHNRSHFPARYYVKVNAKYLYTLLREMFVARAAKLLRGI